MKKILYVLLVFVLLFISACTTTGKYYDNEDNLLGECKIFEEESKIVTEYYTIDGELLGSCSNRVGPGSSGDHGFCTNGEVGIRSCLLKEEFGKMNVEVSGF